MRDLPPGPFPITNILSMIVDADFDGDFLNLDLYVIPNLFEYILLVYFILEVYSDEN